MELKAWKDAWVIFKKDLYTDRMYLIWNAIFMIYGGAMFSFMLYSVDHADTNIHPLADYLMLMMVPMIGFFFSRRSFNYLKEDSYTRMLCYYRTLPIPVKTVMKSRYVQLVFTIIFNSIILFSTIYFVFIFLNKEMSVIEYISFALTWIGYALIINGLYIYLEFLKRGKIYFWLGMLLMLSMVIITFAVAVLQGNLVKYTMDLSVRYALLSPIMWGTLLVGVLLLYFTGLLTIRKLTDRDLV
ncbi:ABC-2 transporter permease [Paenibacillus sp. D2_2]|uniref:ABC-2 transporter permease n=1 Tax=Paenibacillus sp. D2_2 TaxID=3073092 RepID=UPI00281698BF|nr:ABC-2 transporter permease [Paenibacillus sp. D2_2]WMT41565.1 ABC-2 transporter permease [Paenibacillus sp. D2_2]